MIKLNLKRDKHLIGVLALSLCTALQVYGQARGGGGGGGGGFGGGGIGGGAAGGARAGGAAGSSANNSITRTYPANGTIPDAYFTIDPETRRVVVIAPEEAMPYVMQVLTNLDRPKPQVLIKVVFLEVSYNNSLDFGLEGGWTKGIGQSAGAATTANASDVFGLGNLNQSGSFASLATNLNAVGQPLSSFQSTASTVAGGNAGLYQIVNPNYQVTLRAIAQAGKARVLSRPSILARNNQPATITVGQSVPLVTSVSYNGLNGTPINAISYQNVGVILEVTPFITADGLVEMIVAPQVSSIDPSQGIAISQGVYAPIIDIRSANTVAVTPDGQTVILGGLMSKSKSSTDTKVPLLGDIPLLGNLFKRKQSSDTQDELIIFLTPYIIERPSQLAALSDRERAKSAAPGAFTEKELNQFIDNLPAKQSKPARN
jgi:general secretion pathway protein D